MRQEAADDVLSMSDLVVTEHLDQSLRESGEIIHFVKDHGGKPAEKIDFIKVSCFLAEDNQWRYPPVLFPLS